MAKVTCPVCDAHIDAPADGICPECGIALDAAAPAGSHGTPAAQVMDPPSTSDLCPVCSESVPAGATICDSCGIDLAAARAATGPMASASNDVDGEPCPICGADVDPAAAICSDCGVNLAEARAAVPTTRGGRSDRPDGSDSGEPPCPVCSAPRRPGASFCRECGEPFLKSEDPSGLLQPGEYLSGRYRIKSQIGGGGMGTVFLGEDLNLRAKPVAIKAVLNSRNPDLLRAAQQEAENLLGIDHPNIVKLRDIVEKGGIPFLVMDFLEGPDWNDLYEQRVQSTGEAFTSEEALQMILGILPAFEYLHGRRPPVVYRDFKPSQVKVVRDEALDSERYVLLDLGVAYTFTGRPVEAWGTAGYAPPEIGGVSLQPPSMDLATICRTLQGLLGLDLQRFGYGQMPEPQEVPWIPEELYYLLERGTSDRESRRFNTIGELRAQLEGVLRLIQGRTGSLPRPRGAFHMPVVSTLFSGNRNRTTGHLLSLPVPHPDDPAAPALALASDLLHEDKPGDALQQAMTAAALNPDSSDAHLLQTIALSRLGRIEEARAMLKRIDRLDDPRGDWSYAIVAAQIAEESGDLDEAESLFRKVIQLVPGELPPRQKLADLLLRRGRHSEAAGLYEQLVGADPANVEAILNWSDALAAIGDTAGSIRVLRQVGENAVRFVDAQLRMVELLLERAQQEPDALSLAAEAIRSVEGRTQTPRYYKLVGDWWYESYRYVTEKGALDRISAWPNDRPRRSARDLADEARAAYRHFLRIDPQNPLADEIIGRIHFGIRAMM